MMTYKINNEIILLAKNNPELKQKIIEAMRPLCNKKISFYHRHFPEIPIEDMEQEASIAVLNCIDKYMPRNKKEFGFLSFLNNQVFWRLQNYTRKNIRQVCLPAYKFKSLLRGPDVPISSIISKNYSQFFSI